MVSVGEGLQILLGLISNWPFRLELEPTQMPVKFWPNLHMTLVCAALLKQTLGQLLHQCKAFSPVVPGSLLLKSRVNT